MSSSNLLLDLYTDFSVGRLGGLVFPLPAYWEICIQVKKQQLERDMEQQTGSKSGKEYVKAVYCHTAYLN